MPGILVVGARPRSLGEAVAKMSESTGWAVRTAGQTTDHDVTFDIRFPEQCVELIEQERPAHVVCTVGINLEDRLTQQEPEDFALLMTQHLRTNVVGPMTLLSAFVRWRNAERMAEKSSVIQAHFVAISSNSATVPRSTGVGYCASKAALSQAIRCAARAVPDDVIVWALEPGWIQNTPMSDAVDQRLLYEQGRMRGGREADRYDLASMIVGAFEMAHPEVLNGMTIRLDGGER